MKPLIKVEDLKNNHKKPVIELFVKSFCDSEPITKQLDISYEEYEPYAEAVVTKAVKDGLSKVLLDEKNHVIGFVIAEDLADPFKMDLTKCPKLKPVHALLSELSKTFLSGKQFKKGKVLHTWIAAIDPKFRSQGLYRDLGLIHVESAMKKGFDFIYSDFTNELSAKIVRQFDVLRQCNKVNYADFVYESQKPFENVPGAATSYLTPLRPEVKIESLTNCYTLTEKIR